jgi:hypothetical protein
MIRSLLAVVTGFVTWMVVATLANFLIRALLPGYMAAEPTMNFTLAMMLARLAVGVLASVLAGYATAAVARDKMIAVYVFAALLLLCFLPIHYRLWSKFPIWYHAFFLITLAPLVLLGALMQRRQKPSVARIS